MDIRERLEKLDWQTIERALWECGYAKTAPLLWLDECREIIGMYTDPTKFRSRIDMARYRFGIGEDQYFAEPLPALVQALRLHAYPPFAAIANRWMAALGQASAIRRTSLASLPYAGKAGRPSPLLRSCVMKRGAITACIKTSTAISCSPCSSPVFSVNATAIIPAASSCWLSNRPAPNRVARRLSPSRVRSSSSPPATHLSPGLAAIIV